MDFEKISNKENIISFNSTCPFCSKIYTVTKTWKYEIDKSTYIYDLLDFRNCCNHLLLWDSSETGFEHSEEISNLEWFTRMSNLPFRVWDVLQELINNNSLPEGCDVRIRAFYVSGYIVLIFGNNPKMLADIVLEKTKKHIRKYCIQYPSDKESSEQYSELLDSI